jgi:hypothetical protein
MEWSGMQEDPVARRNRGSRTGLWALLGLAVLVVVLVASDLVRPSRPLLPSDPPVAALTMKERVSADRLAVQARDRARRAASPVS